MHRRRITVCVGLITATMAWTPLIARRSQDASPQAAGTRNAVTGTVTTPDGQPVAGTVVTLVERDTLHGAVHFHPANRNYHVLTDERGQYRFENLNFGDYYVAAIPHNQTVTADKHISRAGYRFTYLFSRRSSRSARSSRRGTRVPRGLGLSRTI